MLCREIQLFFLKDRSKKERQSISAKQLTVHDGWMFHKCQTVPNCDIQYTVTPWILSYSAAYQQFHLFCKDIAKHQCAKQ